MSSRRPARRLQDVFARGLQYNKTIAKMTNQQTTEEMRKSLLTKTDTLNLKITKMETNTIKTEITDINRNLEDFKEQHKHEF